MKKKHRDIYSVSYSLRRYYIDEFYIRNIGVFKQGALILDVGGKKKHKRGYFSIDQYPLSVKYANIDASTKPDFVCDVTEIPATDASFDGIVCSEVLEHVQNPKKVLEETFRALKPGGILLICVPFINRIHSDPHDYGRYTDHYWQMVLKTIGFINIEIERQGLFFSVASEMLTSLAHQMKKERMKSKKSRFMKWTICKLSRFGKRMALKRDKKQYFKDHPFFSSYTTGHGIIASKLE